MTTSKGSSEDRQHSPPRVLSVRDATPRSHAPSLASTRVSVHDVETLLVSRLTAAILRQKQKLEQDPDTWLILVDSEREIRRSLQRLSTFSDRNAAVVKDAKKKLAYVEKAVEYLAKHGLGPAPLQIEDADADAG